MSEVRAKRRLSPCVETPPEAIENAAKLPKHSTSRTSEECATDGGDGSEQPRDAAMYADMLSDFDEDWCDFEANAEQLFALDLTQWQRCKVVSVERCTNRNLLVTLEEKNSKERGKCMLCPPWNTIEHIAPGLIVSVQAVKDEASSNHYTVNANDGFFVTNPDQLVSGTTVVGSLYCRRRGVLQEKFRMVDTENQQMHIGTLAHAIFQQCITDDRCRSLEQVHKIAERWLTSSKMVSTLFNYKISSAEALNILDPYFKEIAVFLAKHLHDRKDGGSALGSGKREEKEAITIHKINDIEENIWCHQLGIKGKIDATVSVASRQTGGMKVANGQQQLEVMPLELKTGRASYSFEHTGQLALYEMMMNLVGHRVQGGLLVYLREGKSSKMIGNRNSRRDLIILRNEIAHFLDRWMVRNESTDGTVDTALPMLPVLPEPINNERACVKCPYNTICIVLAKKEVAQPERSEKHGLSIIAEEATGHLSNRDIDYFIRWTGMIYLEQKESIKEYSTRKLWTKKPEERVQKGWCIAGLSIISPVRMVDDSYFHSFAMETNATQERLSSCQIFEVGDYVICSTSKRIAVAAGHIISSVGRELVVSFERDLSVNYGGETFLLDRSESYKSAGFNLGNLAMLLVATEEANRLRRIIIDREKPTFKNAILPKELVPEAKQILEKLNRHQKLATLKAAATNSYCLLKGLPGTGKTQTIVGLIRILTALGESILLTSNTHSAVDNVLKRLAQHEEIKFIRLGSLDRIDPAVRPFSASVLAEQCATPEQLSELYDKFKIVAVTCQGASHPLIVQRTFDYCIVDEATQVFQSSIIRPLLQCKRFLLVGDPEQLPPVIRSNEARSLGADESLFHRLDQEGSFFILPTQYRMNRVLTKLANDFTYDGKLVCGNDIVANATLRLPRLATLRQMYEVERWLMKTISNQIDLSAVVLDTGNTQALNLNHQLEEKEGTPKTALVNCSNISEVALTVYICGALLRAGVEGSAIGVMAPFRAQVESIRQHMRLLLHKQKSTRRSRAVDQTLESSAEDPEEPKDDNCSIEVNTVDQFQGKDKKLIIYSCTRTVSPDGDTKPKSEQPVENGNEILFDKRRLTVAITRAKEKLILIGDCMSLEAYTPFHDLFKVASRVARVNLVDKKDGFEWSNIMDALNLLND